MRFFFSDLRLAGAALGAIIAMAPLCSGACGGNTACFVYGQAAYAQTNSCPAQGSALKHFSDPSCPGDITAVQGEGSFDGEYCCYTVTQQSSSGDGICNLGGGGSTSTGVAGSSGSTGFGGSACNADGDPCPGNFPCCAGLVCDGNAFQCVAPGNGGSGGTGGGITSGGGIGGAGGGISCATCDDEITSMGSTASTLCPAAAPFWDAVTSCACGTGPCDPVCHASFCDGNAADMTCIDCLMDMSGAGCGVQLAACKSN